MHAGSSKAGVGWEDTGRGVLLKGGTAILSSGFLEMSETN